MSRKALSDEERKMRSRELNRRYYLKNKDKIKEYNLKNKDRFVEVPEEPMAMTLAEERALEAKIARLKARPLRELIYVRNP